MTSPPPAKDDRKSAIVTTTSRKRLKLRRAEQRAAEPDDESEATAQVRAFLARMVRPGGALQTDTKTERRCGCNRHGLRVALSARLGATCERLQQRTPNRGTSIRGAPRRLAGSWRDAGGAAEELAAYDSAGEH